MNVIITSFVAGFILVFSSIASYAAMGPLKSHPQNPRYFADSNGEIVYLTGSHTWAVFQERGIEGVTPDFDYLAFLNFLIENNHNFLRLWVWEHAAWMPFRDKKDLIRYKPLCYLRSGSGRAFDGEARFDLNQFNPEFFERLRDRVFAAREKGIYVSVMLFQGLSVVQNFQNGIDPKKGNPWEGHPYNKKNNINGIDGDRNGNGEGEEVHSLADPAITRLQEAYAMKVVDTLNGFDNVIWEIGNQCGDSSMDWQCHMIRFIQEYEAQKPYQHSIWMSLPMQDSHKDLSECPADALSLPAMEDDPGNPPAVTGNKVIIADTGTIDPEMNAIDSTWVWKSFLRGMNPILLDPYRDILIDSPEKPVSEYDKLRQALGQTRLYSKAVNLAQMMPHDELSSTGFCLANPGEEYLAYQPESEKLFWVDLPAGSFQVDLFSPREGKIKTTLGIQSTESKKQLIPIFFYGDVVAHIQKADFEETGQEKESPGNKKP